MWCDPHSQKQGVWWNLGHVNAPTFMLSLGAPEKDWSGQTEEFGESGDCGVNELLYQMVTIASHQIKFYNNNCIRYYLHNKYLNSSYIN